MNAPTNLTLDAHKAEMNHVLERQKAAHLRDGPWSADQRIERLNRCIDLLIGHQAEIAKAVSTDFGSRSPEATALTDVAGSIGPLKFARDHLAKWMKPQKRKTTPAILGLFGAKASVQYQPKGVVGVISPWNFPVNLTFAPLAGVFAAGNRAMIKPSEFTPATSDLLKAMFAKAFSEEEVAVFVGGPEVGQAFSGLAFDHLVFTGATSVARHVMRAAAENLVPVTLELGGKSPAIISADVPLADAAERIAFGKTMNAGQTCVAPDYVLVPQERVEGFIAAYRSVVQRFYPTLANNPDYTAIINERQLNRLKGYVSDAQSKGAQVIPLLGDDQGRRMSHSLVLNVSDDMKLMQDEIFGPLLPIVPYQRIEDAFAYVNDRPRPLALYYFGYDKAEQQRVLHETHSGGVCLNDTLLHVAQDDMPFGGVGPSGMGHYHGHEGFLTFSKAKGVFIKQRFNAAKFIYPPYGTGIQKLINKLFVR